MLLIFFLYVGNSCHENFGWRFRNTTNTQNIARTSFNINKSFQINLMYRVKG